jgi:simple sugar transport system ATP-binding protein
MVGTRRKPSIVAKVGRKLRTGFTRITEFRKKEVTYTGVPQRESQTEEKILMKKGQPLVEMKNISKSFGEVHALRNVNFRVGQNEVVGLVGDNGAGKTTLIKILTGVYRPDKGEIYFKCEKRRFSSPGDCRSLGIEPVHQRGALIDEINVCENFFLGREITKSFGPIRILDRKKMDELCISDLKNIGINIRTPAQRVSTLSGGERQAISIGRAIRFGGKLLVLDEPTAALSLKETKKVLTYIAGAKKQGDSIILISHLIRHVYPVADRFVVLDRGRKIGDFKKNEVSREELEKLIVSGRLREK